uniref:Uncharacterized protein n=1 Tax=Lepeophtheirus salmonis TaxID=72036 RepID=A0A0K2V5I6_LEPSM
MLITSVTDLIFPSIKPSSASKANVIISQKKYLGQN